MKIEDLIKDGWKKIEDSPIFLYEKEVGTVSPLNNNKENKLKLVAHSLFNNISISIMIPDGGIINLNIENIKDLKKLESMLGFYDSPY